MLKKIFIVDVYGGIIDVVTHSKLNYIILSSGYDGSDNYDHLRLIAKIIRMMTGE